MAIRDNEIQRLIHYAKGVGVKVVIYSKSKKGSEAEWTLDGTQISVYAGKNKSKTSVILDLIHEIGHQLTFIHERNRKPDMKFDEAISRENLYQVETSIPTPKKLRKKIFDVELAGTAYWDIIVKDTDIKIPKWKIEASKEFDMWMYEMYYINGHFPKGKSKKDHWREVAAKHKNKKEQ
jgi:hypothetical protein